MLGKVGVQGAELSQAHLFSQPGLNLALAQDPRYKEGFAEIIKRQLIAAQMAQEK